MQCNVITHEECLNIEGFDICSPISGSMRPMIRVRRDSVLFVKPAKRLKCYDVALYKRNELTIMHRVIGVLPDGYLIRGDNSIGSEIVSENQILGVMQGFYRDEKYIPCDNIPYNIYARVWVALHPMLVLYKKGKRLVKLYPLSRTF